MGSHMESLSCVSRFLQCPEHELNICHLYGPRGARFQVVKIHFRKGLLRKLSFGKMSQTLLKLPVIILSAVEMIFDSQSRHSDARAAFLRSRICKLQYCFLLRRAAQLRLYGHSCQKQSFSAQLRKVLFSVPTYEAVDVLLSLIWSA